MDIYYYEINWFNKTLYLKIIYINVKISVILILLSANVVTQRNKTSFIVVIKPILEKLVGITQKYLYCVLILLVLAFKKSGEFKQNIKNKL